IEVLDDADVALWSIRRRTLPRKQMQVLRKYIADGKPLVAIRTTSHAFCLRNKKPEAGLDEWPAFDREVLGCFYQNHHGNNLETRVRALPGAAKHPILEGVGTEEFRVHGSLYRSLPLSAGATALMTGRAGDITTHQPVAWTYKSPAGGRVFYTSLGHPKDFEVPGFDRLLLNGIRWAAGLSP
ncbi:MAG: ThuA domain-containing protein, partial [Planctomycetota bacterium]|nr:ThuA domain-containing protein [Planctomycetota bacterium]